MAKIEVHCDRVDQSKVLLIGGGFFDRKTSIDGIPAFGVPGEDLTVVAVDDIDA